MPRLSRRDRRIRAAFKRQLYVPDPVEFAEPWDEEFGIIPADDFDLEEVDAREHAH